MSDAAPVTATVIRSLRGEGVRIGVVDEPACRRIFVDGELDLETASLLRAVLNDAAGPVCLDMGGVEFCDVSGLNVILEADRRLAADGHRLVLIAVPAQLRQLLRVLALDDDLTLELGELGARTVRTAGLPALDAGSHTSEVGSSAKELPLQQWG